jgi:hypothetical protein
MHMSIGEGNYEWLLSELRGGGESFFQTKPFLSPQNHSSSLPLKIKTPQTNSPLNRHSHTSNTLKVYLGLRTERISVELRNDKAVERLFEGEVNQRLSRV